MGTLAGDKSAWGDDWGYDRAGRHYFEASEIPPSREEEERQEPPSDLPSLLFCVVFWLLIGAAVVLQWMGT